MYSTALCIGLLLSCATSADVVSLQSEPDLETQVEKQSLFEKLKENNHLSIDERIALYHQLKKEHSTEYSFDNDRELNQYGYSLLSEDKTKEAIEIFKLLISEFPNVANAYDSMGEAYLKDGNEELSLLNYEKSVKLDPKNTHAIDQITILKGLEILVTDWGKEFFHFPLHFAPQIPYEGVEEVVFPRNWIKPDSTDFWSYVFVWALDNKKKVTASELESTLKQYFDGLMGVVKDDKEAEIIQTSAQFEKNTYAQDSADFIGELTIFDGFATNKALKLNAKIYSNYCEEKEQLILLFRFSPREFNQPIWAKLATVAVRSTVCEE